MVRSSSVIAELSLPGNLDRECFRSGKDGQKRRTLVCFLISVGAVLKECASLLSLYLQVCGSFQISQGAGG